MDVDPQFSLRPFSIVEDVQIRRTAILYAINQRFMRRQNRCRRAVGNTIHFARLGIEAAGVTAGDQRLHLFTGLVVVGQPPAGLFGVAVIVKADRKAIAPWPADSSRGKKADCDVIDKISGTHLGKSHRQACERHGRKITLQKHRRSTLSYFPPNRESATMDPVEIFKADVSPEFLTELYQKICDAYASSRFYVDSQPIGDDERYNLMPWTRRAHVESRLRDAANVAKLEFVTEETGFWRHVVATSGRIRLTQSTAKTQETPLRSAGYKMRYAKEQEQMYLPGLEELAPKLNIQDPHLYAVLLHRAPIDADIPDFVVVRFPLADLSDYHPGEVDLSVYSGVPAAMPAVETESVEDMAVPKLKVRKNVDGK